VHLALALSIALSWAAQADLPRSLAQDPVQDPFKPDPLPPHQSNSAIVDLEWLDLTPGVGMAVYSSKFRADPAIAFSLRAHAPMPWLSPSSDAKGEYFGLFAEAAFATIDRDLSPIVTDRSGLCMFCRSEWTSRSFAIRPGSWSAGRGSSTPTTAASRT
jgi:hypothetical protein